MIANIEYHTDGKTIKSFYVIQENDVRRGSYESYYRNGQPCKRGAYKDGKEDGLWEYFYENGRLWKKCTYKNGEKDGLYVTYYENGQLGEKCFYKNGEKDGPYISYREDGRLDTKYVYKDGKRLAGQAAQKYLKEWSKTHHTPKTSKKIISAHLNQLDSQIKLAHPRQMA